MRARLLFSISIMALFFLSNSTSAKTEASPPYEAIGDGPRFYMDYSNFLGADNLTYTEFYIQISYHELQFIKHKNKFRSGYDLELSILNDDNKIVEHYSNTDIFEVKTFEATESTSQARVSMVAFTVEPDNYKIQAKIIDHETRHSSELVAEFTALSFKQNSLIVSDIQFSQKIELCHEQRSFVKNNRYVEPNAVRLFANGLTDIFIYFEVYNLTANSGKQIEEYTAHFSIINEQGKEIAKFKKTHKTPGTTAAHSLKLAVEKFTRGKYDLTVRILDHGTGQTTKTTKSFTVVDYPLAALNKNHGIR